MTIISEDILKVAIESAKHSQLKTMYEAQKIYIAELEREKAGLVAQLKTIRNIFRSENLTQNETAIALQQLASVIDELPEQQLNQIKAEAVIGLINAHTKIYGASERPFKVIEVEDAEKYAASIAKGE